MRCVSRWSVLVGVPLLAKDQDLNGRSVLVGSLRGGWTKITQGTWALLGAYPVSPDEAEQGLSTVPRMVGEAEGVAVVNRR
jgi:hypothetical protein